MKGAVIALALFAVCISAQSPYDEAFTIFIDLEDFHVTQVGNHEFMTGDKIGEHDNVLLHLSEDEMRHHIAKHDTHDCEAPSGVHEVVSFIQEKMYEAPSAPNFIDDMINTNYVQNGAWENLNAKQAYPAANPAAAQFPFSAGGAMWAPQAPFPAPVAKAAQAAPVQAPVAAVSAPVSVSAPKVAADPAKEEEDAVRRFRDAYQAFKYLNKAVEGLGGDSAPSLSAPSSSSSDNSAEHGNWWSSLFDNNDKHLLEMLTQHVVGRTANSFLAPPPQQQRPMSVFNAGIDGSGFGGDYDKALNSIVDEAVKGAMSTDAFSDPMPATNSLAPVFEKPHHHHHHHRHHEDESIQQEEVSEQSAQAEPAVALQAEPQAASAPSFESLDPHPTLSASDKQALQDLVAALSTKEADVKKLLQETLAAKGMQPMQASNIVQAMKEVAAQIEAPKALEAKSVVEAAKPAETVVFSKQAVPVPAATSHIEKAPKASDYVPESVYVQQSVPFVNSPQMPAKHVAKRILIPRMEEPGPVIGGGSRPLHIQIPFPDNEPTSFSTRPSAPSQLSSVITTAKDAAVPTSTAISIGAEKSVSSQVPSVKASTIATANDEALSAPEVVIF